MQTLDCAMQVALAELRRAAVYAANLDKDRWDFAVELEGLLALGASFSDLRWLLCKGYLQHAVETTLPGDSVRSFRGVADLFLPRGSCFVLTASGIALLDGALGHFTSNGEASRLNGAAISATVAVSGPVPCPAIHTRNGKSPVPTWDRCRQELRVEGVIVKQFKVPAPNQELVLAAFQEEGWPVHIDDPLPPRPIKTQSGVCMRRSPR